MEQHVKPSLRIRRRRHEIEKLLAEFGKAGCTVEEFCAVHHIKPVTFRKWQARNKNAVALVRVNQFKIKVVQGFRSCRLCHLQTMRYSLRYAVCYADQGSTTKRLLKY